MRRLLIVGLAVAALGLAAGCSLAPSDKVMEQLGKSERSWCVFVAYGPGVFRAGGTGVQSGSMSCTNEGLSVTDTASKIGVPILVVPQISIGQPIPR